MKKRFLVAAETVAVAIFFIADIAIMIVVVLLAVPAFIIASIGSSNRSREMSRGTPPPTKLI